jgi:hypothetical protein
MRARRQEVGMAMVIAINVDSPQESMEVTQARRLQARARIQDARNAVRDRL